MAWNTRAVSQRAGPGEDDSSAGPVPTPLALQAHLVTPGVVRAFQRSRRACPRRIRPIPRIEDSGGDGGFVAPENRGRSHDNVPTAWGLGPGTVLFRPAKWPVPRLRRVRLRHPVKTLPDTARDTHRAPLRRPRNGVTRMRATA